MHHWTVLSACAGALALSAILRVDPPERVYLPGLRESPLPELCTLRRLTAIPCPACGMTRSFISAAHFQYAAAFGYHPLGPLFFLAVLAQVPSRLWRIARRGSTATVARSVESAPPRATQRRLHLWWPWVVAAILLATWVGRLAAIASE